ncbi:hypothetical protein C3L33_00185, partial [Rhododendron williamsianum]
MPVQDITPPPDAAARNGAVESSEAEDEAWVWAQIKAEARRDAESEPALASYLYSTIISHSSLCRSLSFHLGNKLCSSTLLSTLLYDLFLHTLSSSDLLSSTVADLRAARERDPACTSYSHCLLNYKGHPKIGDGVLLGAGATVLGNVRVGEGAKVGAGSLVLIEVPPWTTAVGNPAKLVGGKEQPKVHEDVPGESMDHTSFISHWSDYVI